MDPRFTYQANNENGNYFDFANGVDVGEYMVNQWIEEGLKFIGEQIKNGVEKPSTYSMSGNTLVTIFAYKSSEEGKWDVSVNVSKDHKQASLYKIDVIEEPGFVTISKDDISNTRTDAVI